jgi:hypothetical protein
MEENALTLAMAADGNFLNLFRTQFCFGSGSVLGSCRSEVWPYSSPKMEYCTVPPFHFGGVDRGVC